MSRQDIYDTYNDEVKQVEEEYEDGKITAVDRDRYLKNLANNLDSDLGEFES